MVLNANMDIVDIALEILDSDSSSDLEFFLELLGLFGPTGIELCMSLQAKFRIIFGVLLRSSSWSRGVLYQLAFIICLGKRTEDVQALLVFLRSM